MNKMQQAYKAPEHWPRCREISRDLSHSWNLCIAHSPGPGTITEESAQGGGDQSEAPMSGHDRTVPPRKSQQLWLPTKDLPKINLVNIPAWSGQAFGSLHPWGVIDCWWLLREEQSDFFKVVVPGRSAKLQWWPRTHEYMGGTNWAWWVIWRTVGVNLRGFGRSGGKYG